MIRSLLQYYWKQARRFDAILVAAIVLLTIGGILMVYSASVWQALGNNDPPTYYVERQLVALVPALIAFFILSVFPIHILRRFAWPGYLFAFLLVLTVLIIGRHISGATRWVSISGFTFQPSEIAKLAIVLLLATWFSQQPGRVRSFRSGLLFALLIIAIPAGLVELEPDLGTSLVVAAGGLGVLFAAGLPKRYLVGVIPLVFIVVFVLAHSASYRIHRLEAFTNPLNPENSTSVTYQVVQGLIALGSGGTTGEGIGSGIQKFNYLPQPATDSIFAVIGEELGFVGAMSTLLIFAALGWRGYMVARDADSQFGGLLAYGITTSIMSQAVLNIASTTSALPFTGVPLPFISYGGSSLVMSFVAAGLLLNISAHPAPYVAPTVIAKEAPQPPSAPHFSEILKLHHRSDPRRRYRSRRPVRTVRTR